MADLDGQLDTEAQLDADLAAMETEEAEQAQATEENAAADEEMVEEDYAPPNPDLINIPSSRSRVYMTHMEFLKTILDDFLVDELLHSSHPREMLPLFRPDFPRGGPIFNPCEHKKTFFSDNTYLKPRDSYLLRF